MTATGHREPVEAPPSIGSEPPVRTATVVRPGREDRARARQARLRRRRLTAAAVAAAVLVAGVVAVRVARDGWGPLGPSGAGGGPIAEPHTVLVAWPTGDGSAALVLLGAPEGSSRGGAVLFPGRTQVEVASFGSRTLAEALDSAGPGSAALAIENALGYPVGDEVVVDADRLAALFEAGAPLRVDLRKPVERPDGLLPAGLHTMSAADAAVLVTAPADGASELDHLVVMHAVVEGWLASLDGDALGLTERAVQDVAGADSEAARRIVAVLDELSRRRITFDTLDVTPIGVPGEESYTIDEEAAGDEMADLFPGLAYVAPSERVRVEVLNGSGRAGLAGEVVTRLVPVGARVVLTGNAAEFGLDKTLIVLQEARFRERGEAFADALGVGEVRMAREPSGVADISVVLGADFDPGG